MEHFTSIDPLYHDFVYENRNETQFVLHFAIIVVGLRLSFIYIQMLPLNMKEMCI